MTDRPDPLFNLEQALAALEKKMAASRKQHAEWYARSPGRALAQGAAATGQLNCSGQWSVKVAGLPAEPSQPAAPRRRPIAMPARRMKMMGKGNNGK